MGLENIKKKLNEAQASPYTRKTIIRRPDGKTEVITEHITYEEWLADMEEEEGEEGEEDGW